MSAVCFWATEDLLEVLPTLVILDVSSLMLPPKTLSSWESIEIETRPRVYIWRKNDKIGGGWGSLSFWNSSSKWTSNIYFQQGFFHFLEHPYCIQPFLTFEEMVVYRVILDCSCCWVLTVNHVGCYLHHVLWSFHYTQAWACGKFLL